jgi:hypothetical protein
MKRDMDLVRQLIMQIADSERPLSLDAFITDYSRGMVIYHLELLQAHGFIDGQQTKSWGGETATYTVIGLTWDGQDFCDALSDQKVWNRTKNIITKTVGTTTFDVIRKTLEMVALDFIKLQMGNL